MLITEHLHVISAIYWYLTFFATHQTLLVDSVLKFKFRSLTITYWFDFSPSYSSRECLLLNVVTLNLAQTPVSADVTKFPCASSVTAHSRCQMCNILY